MPWETRKGGQRYYTRTVRIDGRRERQYFGNGDEARSAADLDTAGRAWRDANRLARVELDAIDKYLDTVFRRTAELMDLTLQEAGCYRHDRGRWRKKRGIKRQTNES